jgi:hypothetical protein
MAGATLTTADSALKEDYQPAIRETLNNKVFILSQIEKNSKDVEGRRAVLSLHVSRNSGVGARAELGTLPTAGSQGYVEERVLMRYNYGRIQISGPVIKAMKSNTGSFTRAVDSETKGVTNDLKRDVNRQIFGTSDGKIAQAASASSQVITLTTPTAVQLRQLEIGMVANPTLRASAVSISSVDTANGTVTVVGTLSASTTTTDFIFRSGAAGATTSQKELTGLQSIVDSTGSLFNVDPATYPTWSSTENSNSGTNRTPTETLFAKVADDASIAAGDATINLWVTTPGVQRSLAASLLSQKRFNDTVALKAGYSGIPINTAGSSTPSALTWDRDCPANMAFGLSTEHLMQHQESEWEFMDDDGSVLSRVSGVDAYEAILYKYHELTTDHRAAHAKIVDLTES